MHSFILTFHTVLMSGKSTYSTHLDPLVKKCAVRIVVGAPYKAHTLDIFRRLNIVQLDFKKLYKYNVYIFIYKLVHNLLPPSVISTFSLNNHIHDHDTRHSGRLHVTTVEFEPRKRALRHQSSILHNSNQFVDYNVPFVSFKYAIKTLLLFASSDWLQ